MIEHWTCATRPDDFELDRAIALMSLHEDVAYPGRARLNANQELDNRVQLRLSTLVERRDGYYRQRQLEIGRNGLSSVAEILSHGPLLRVVEHEIFSASAQIRCTYYDPQTGQPTHSVLEYYK